MLLSWHTTYDDNSLALNVKWNYLHAVPADVVFYIKNFEIFEILPLTSQMIVYTFVILFEENWKKKLSYTVLLMPQFMIKIVFFFFQPILIDAKGHLMGRLAAIVAKTILQGKYYCVVLGMYSEEIIQKQKFCSEVSRKKIGSH